AVAGAVENAREVGAARSARRGARSALPDAPRRALTRPSRRSGGYGSYMAVAIVHSRALAGVHAPVVTVEVHLAGGLPGVHLVGLPQAEVREARDRVRAALQNAQFEFPARKVTVNLAPADLPKESGRFDLPIALGILAATGQIPAPALSQYEFAGELALTGDLRPIRGALAMTLKAHRD